MGTTTGTMHSGQKRGCGEEGAFPQVSSSVSTFVQPAPLVGIYPSTLADGRRFRCEALLEAAGSSNL